MTQRTKKTDQEQKLLGQQHDPAAGDLQKKKPSNKTEGALQQPTAGDDNKSSDALDVKSAIYQMGDNVSPEYRDQLTIVEGTELLLTEKKDRRFFLLEMTKPIPREKRKLGKKSPLTPAQRRAARIEIKHLDREIFNLEEDHRTALGYLTKLVSAGKSSLDDQLLRDRSQSDFYLRRNRNRLINNVASLINETRSESMEEVTALVRAAKKNGAKAIDEFRDMFIDFLRTKRYPLYILCTGKESFKQEVLNTFRNALRKWNPRRNELGM